MLSFYRNSAKAALNKKEIFEPIDEKNIGMYVCGPTVYDDPHIGNARPCFFLISFQRFKL